jgi:hypothetical protein
VPPKATHFGLPHEPGGAFGLPELELDGLGGVVGVGVDGGGGDTLLPVPLPPEESLAVAVGAGVVVCFFLAESSPLSVDAPVTRGV